MDSAHKKANETLKSLRRRELHKAMKRQAKAGRRNGTAWKSSTLKKTAAATDNRHTLQDVPERRLNRQLFLNTEISDDEKDEVKTQRMKIHDEHELSQRCDDEAEGVDKARSEFDKNDEIDEYFLGEEDETDDSGAEKGLEEEKGMTENGIDIVPVNDGTSVEALDGGDSVLADMPSPDVTAINENPFQDIAGDGSYDFGGFDNNVIDRNREVRDADIEFDLSAVDLEKVNERSRVVVEARTGVRECPRVRQRRPTIRRAVLAPEEKELDTMRRVWRRELAKLKALKPDFFTCKEATFEDENPAMKGKPVYSAIPINERNNADLQAIYTLKYDRKVRNGGSINSFKQLVTVAGQFMRLRVVAGLSDLKSLYLPGKLFEAVCDRECIDAFLNHYDARGQVTTVMTKALHLRKICEHAKLFFSDKDNHLLAEAERSRVKTQKAFNMQKSLARSLATRKKELDERIAEASVLLPADFRTAIKRIRAELDGMLRSFRSVEALRGTERMMGMIQQNNGIIRKWFINILLLLMFSAGGQRPQVYCQLQSSDHTELEEMKASFRRSKFFELRTLFEKTKRALDMPNVIVPSYALTYVEFHANTMRSIVLEKCEVDETRSMNKPLMVHTENGNILTTPQVANCLKNFIAFQFPWAKNVTSMSLRSSYGTMMMQAYREKKIFTDIEKDIEFLAILAKCTNTSPEQLMTTYIGIDRQDFEDYARKLVAIIDEIGDEKEEMAKKDSSKAGNCRAVFDDLLD